MQVERDDLAALLQIQQIDLEIMRQTKQLDELPQREAILSIRQKRDAIEAKRAQVESLRKEAAHKLSRIADEDASLAKKEAGVQAAIEAAHGDFRNAEARTKELAGIAKRRASLAADHDAAGDELGKIEALGRQVAAALDALAAQEQEAVESFQREGGALKNGIAQLQAQRAGAASGVDAAVLDLYDKAAARSGGVAVARLDGTRCGACRAPIEGGRLIDLKAQAPLGTCPACKRLLIIA
ncbi:MAG: hypothetical protein HFJ75_04185 [Eggerthellaceae bacterium]|nr:hypothetical protein [Eggerthellaceae bacterium]